MKGSQWRCSVTRNLPLPLRLYFVSIQLVFSWQLCMYSLGSIQIRFRASLTRVCFLRYTESVFAAFAFAGMFYWSKRNWPTMALCFFVGGFARSNGFLLAGFPLFSLWQRSIHFKLSHLSSMVLLIISAIVSFVPFALFQYYGWLEFCSDPSTVRPWCNTDRPLLYSFVQDFYWYDRTLARFQSLQEPKIRFFGLGMLDFCVTGL
jgi:Gpi18-like mannosyltransferase